MRVVALVMYRQTQPFLGIRTRVNARCFTHSSGVSPAPRSILENVTSARVNHTVCVVCVCERERESVCVCECECLCVCVRERERERESVCVCV